MMTSSNGNIFRVTCPLCGTGEFPPQRPMRRSFDGFFDLRLNKRLSKQSWGWWFETPSWWLWRHCNVSELLSHILQGWFTRNGAIVALWYCDHVSCVDPNDKPHVRRHFNEVYLISYIFLHICINVYTIQKSTDRKITQAHAIGNSPYNN